MEFIAELHQPHYSNDKDEDDDPVNHPPHYNNGDVECIDAMRSAFGDKHLKLFCKMNAIKYIWRCSLHEDGNDINLRKAIWFLRMSLGDDPRQKIPKT